MLDVAKSLPEDPEELRRFTALLLAEVKSRAMLIEKLRPTRGSPQPSLWHFVGDDPAASTGA